MADIDYSSLDSIAAVYPTMTHAVLAGDELAEAIIRYAGLNEAFVAAPQLRSQLNAQLERAKAEISRLRAIADQVVRPNASAGSVEENFGKVVPIDGRFAQTG